ncbi:MAG: cation acetate symporter [Bacteroidetes bacterium]|nr:cation acetate symporter [Rhodothermaceae bacterium RA]RMH62500.1 MAG: cation acetate symporter [Bacteroidota bacterium]
MGIQGWTWVTVGLTFAAYLYIGYRSRVASTRGFYVAGQGVPAIANGAATAADWMSAASFISMAGLISFLGFDGSVYLMGWTGGYVLLALLLAPFLRKFGKYTVPDFVAERFYSKSARIVAAVAAIFVSFTYVAGQMGGVGVAFSRFLEVPFEVGVGIGMVIVAFFAVLGGMKGITYTQVAQYCVLIFAYTIPVVAIALVLTGNPVPQIAIGEILPKLEAIQQDLGLSSYSGPFTHFSMLNVFCVTVCLMVGTAGLPHVIVRFYTVKSVRDARWSAFWALLFIALLYTTAPAVAMFAKYYILQQFVEQGPEGFTQLAWVQNWAQTGLIDVETIRAKGDVEALLASINRDIIVLATPEIAGLSAFVVALVAAGGLAAALSTASGLLLVISSSLAHDIYGSIINPQASDRQRLFVGRVMIFLAVILAGLLGIYPLGFVAEVVAFAFGLAAASFFPTIVLGIFWKRANKQGAIAGMSVGLVFTFLMIALMRAQNVVPGMEEPIIETFLGINAQGVGVIGMLLNFAVTVGVSLATPPPPPEVQTLVEQIRYPRVMGAEELRD